MAIVGHWSSLAEAQKLVQSRLLAGVIEEIIEEGQLVSMFPVFQIDSKSIKYNREQTLPNAAFYDINEQIPWTANVDYTVPVEVELKRILRQDVLDQFMRDTYKDPNDYRSLILSGLNKGCMRTIEDKFIYGDETYTNMKEFDGLHAFSALQSGDLNIDEAGALSFMNMRKMVDAVKVPHGTMTGQVFWLMSHIIARRIDTSQQEAGIASYAGPGQVTYGVDDVGKRISFFDGIPIIRSDYMVAEKAGTGEGASAMEKFTTGTEEYSIFLIRMGQIMEGGLSMAFGGAEGGNPGEFFSFTDFPNLEDYDAEGMRLKAYVALALGSTKSLGRIYGITDTKLIA